MANNKVNLMWKSFKGIRKLNSINSDTVLGAEEIHNVTLSKEKSGKERSIRSSGWVRDFAEVSSNVVSLAATNFSGYPYSNQLVAFTVDGGNIIAKLIADDSGVIEEKTIATFPNVSDVYDSCMTQWGDRLVLCIAFGAEKIGFIAYSGTVLADWTSAGDSWYYREINISEISLGNVPVKKITSLCPYQARLVINGISEYNDDSKETVFGVWFSEAGQPLNFASSYITAETGTSAFFVETGEYVNKVVNYNGIMAFGATRAYNIVGSTQSDIGCHPIVARGVTGNAVFVLNGQCAYVDSIARNIFTLRDNIDGTIGFNQEIGGDIQDYLSNVNRVSINTCDRIVRMTKPTGESLVFDADENEWTHERLDNNAFCVTFANREVYCNGTNLIKEVTSRRESGSVQNANNEGFYSYYKTNIMWLDSQTSIKSHIYPFAIVLEPQTNNDFFVRFTVDRNEVYNARVTKAGFSNVATYSATDEVPENGSMFVEESTDLSGRVFFGGIMGNDILVTVEPPKFWRYLQIEIYTNSPNMEFNISGIEAKQTFIDDEQLDY